MEQGTLVGATPSRIIMGPEIRCGPATFLADEEIRHGCGCGKKEMLGRCTSLDKRETDKEKNREGKKEK